jgi:hypothetical protein
MPKAFVCFAPLARSRNVSFGLGLRLRKSEIRNQKSGQVSRSGKVCASNQSRDWIKSHKNSGSGGESKNRSLDSESAVQKRFKDVAISGHQWPSFFHLANECASNAVALRQA